MPFALADNVAANSRNLSRLCLLRGILIVALVLTALLTGWLQGVALWHDSGLWLALLLFTVFNGWTLWRLRRGGPVSETELFTQLAVDVLLMTLVLYCTGGSTNPFVSYYLVPLTIAAATLRLGFTVALALLTLSTYSLMLDHYIPFAPFGGLHAVDLASADSHVHHHMTLHAGAGSEEGFNLHVFGMWLNFLLSAGLITFFVTRMSNALREQDRRLAEQHERLLQREQVVALGALAAGAAHELGTPLSTMSIIARDVENDLPADSPLREEVAVLRRQLALCRDILHKLRAQAESEAPVMLLDFVRDSVERMEILHPSRQFFLHMRLSDCSVRPPATLAQVLTNLLDNAAQAARTRVNMTLREENGFCLFEIEDDGPGVAPEIAAHLGKPFVSDKRDGLGIGYFLSHASVNQVGGSIHLQQGVEGGVLTQLRMPWTALQRETT